MHIAGVRLGVRLLTTIAVLKLALVGAADAGGVRERRRHLGALRAVRGAARRGARRFGARSPARSSPAFFSFGGWWEVTKIAGEVRDPARTLPRALWLGLAVVTLVYALATLAFIYVVPIEQVAAGRGVRRAGRRRPSSAGAAARSWPAIVIVCVLGSLGRDA